MDIIPIEGFELQITSKINALRSLISFVKYSKQSRAPIEFIDLLDDILAKVNDKFLLEIKNIRSVGFDNEEEEVTKYALTIMPFIRAIHEKFCVFLDTSEHIYLSNETLFALRNLTSEFSNNFKLTLVPSFEYTYTVYAFQNLYENLAKPFNIEGIEINKFPKWFIFLQYPNIEAQNILLNCVLAHEIAHFKDFQDDISDSLIKKIHIEETSFGQFVEEQAQKKINKLDEEEDPRQLTLLEVLGKKRIEQDSYELISKITSNWLKEIVADLLALRTLGPAFLYSLIQFSVLLELMGNYTHSHPASSWRIKYCIDEMKELGSLETIKNERIKLYLKSWEEYINQIHKEPETGSFKVSFLTLQNELANIQHNIRLISKPFTFNMKKYNDKIEQLKKDYFLKCIPPTAYWDKKGGNLFLSIKLTYSMQLGKFSLLKRKFFVRTSISKI